MIKINTSKSFFNKDLNEILKNNDIVSNEYISATAGYTHQLCMEFWVAMVCPMRHETSDCHYR